MSRLQKGFPLGEANSRRTFKLLLAVALFSSALYKGALAALGIDLDDTSAFTCMAWSKWSSSFVDAVFDNPPVASRLRGTFNLTLENSKLSIGTLKGVAHGLFHDEIDRYFKTDPTAPRHLTKLECDTLAVRQWLFVIVSVSSQVRQHSRQHSSLKAWALRLSIIALATLASAGIAGGCVSGWFRPVDDPSLPFGSGGGATVGCKAGALHAAKLPTAWLFTQTYNTVELPYVTEQCYSIQQRVIHEIEEGVHDSGYRVRCVLPLHQRDCSAVDECSLPTEECDVAHLTRWLNSTAWSSADASVEHRSWRALDFDDAVARVRASYNFSLTASWVWRLTTVGLRSGLHSCRYLEGAWSNPGAGPSALLLLPRALAARKMFWAQGATALVACVLAALSWSLFSTVFRWSDRLGAARAPSPADDNVSAVPARAQVTPRSVRANGELPSLSSDAIIAALEDSGNLESHRAKGALSNAAPDSPLTRWHSSASEYIAMATAIQLGHIAAAFAAARAVYDTESGAGWAHPVTHAYRFLPELPALLRGVDKPVERRRAPGFSLLTGTSVNGPHGVEAGTKLYMRCINLGFAIMHISTKLHDGRSGALELYEILEKVGWVRAARSGGDLEQLHSLLVQAAAEWEAAVHYRTPVHLQLSAFCSSAPPLIVALSAVQRHRLGVVVAHAAGDPTLAEARTKSGNHMMYPALLDKPDSGGRGRRRG